MFTVIKSFREIAILSVALTVALMANFAYGQWANPTQEPTGGNVAAPLNVGNLPQVKTGDLDINGLTLTSGEPEVYFHDTTSGHADSRIVTWNDGLLVQHNTSDNPASPTWKTGMFVKDNTEDAATPNFSRFVEQVRAVQYCNFDGTVCFRAEDVGAGTPPPPPPPPPPGPTGSYQTFGFSEAQIKHEIAKTNPAAFYINSGGAGYGSWGPATNPGSAQDLCARFGAGIGDARYISHTARTWDSPRDNQVAFWDGSNWGLRNARDWNNVFVGLTCEIYVPNGTGFAAASGGSLSACNRISCDSGLAYLEGQQCVNSATNAPVADAHCGMVASLQACAVPNQCGGGGGER